MMFDVICDIFILLPETLASTLTDTLLAGMALNCLRSELYLYSLSIIFRLMERGPVPVNLMISSVSGEYE
ncbi:hypothetical protein INR49_025937 [Caranx melampygus]|nr:hypothetical protein INR49_025937 [Caranx melampygus]